jgi:hypothetical protein
MKSWLKHRREWTLAKQRWRRQTGRTRGRRRWSSAPRTRPGDGRRTCQGRAVNDNTIMEERDSGSSMRTHPSAGLLAGGGSGVPHRGLVDLVADVAGQLGGQRGSHAVGGHALQYISPVNIGWIYPQHVRNQIGYAFYSPEAGRTERRSSRSPSGSTSGHLHIPIRPK